jgi:DNA-binding phage protein
MNAKRSKPNLADQIRAAIEKSRMTRYAIWQKSGVDQSALHRFMVKGVNLQVESLEAVAAALGLEIVLRRKKGG